MKKLILSFFFFFFCNHQQAFGERNGAAFDEQSSLPTVQHGDGNILLWGCVAVSDLGDRAQIGKNGLH